MEKVGIICNEFNVIFTFEFYQILLSKFELKRYSFKLKSIANDTIFLEQKRLHLFRNDLHISVKYLEIGILKVLALFILILPIIIYITNDKKSDDNHIVCNRHL